MSLLDRLKKNSKVKLSDALGKVKFVDRSEAVTHALPLNIALEGSFEGGIRPGVIQFAGPSRHFKSNIALIACRAWMDKYPDAVLLFYDSEGGSKMEMFNNAGIDTDRVLHTPIRNVEQLKFDMFTQLEALSPNENIIIMIDSIGNLASKREVDNAENENSAADMTRAKELKSLWRIVTPYFQEKGVPCIVINHTYETMEMFSKTVVSGGQGSILASDDIFVIGRQVDKDTKSKDLKGFKFILTIFKSRTVREGRKIPLVVSFENGIETYASLLDICIEIGIATSVKGPWYTFIDQETGEADDKNFMRKDTLHEKFWEKKLADPKFQRAFEDHYRLDAHSLLHKAEAEAEAEDEEDDAN